MKKRRSKRKILLGVVLTIIACAVLFVGGLATYWYGGQKGKPYHIGATFSVKYAKELGVDPKEIMTAAINDLHVRQFRLMSYWDDLEPVRGTYDFSELDWQMKMAEESGSHVSLAIGLRQPRWPECHTPEWAKQLPANEKRELLMTFMTQVVQRYKSSPALMSYQLENEALNTAFGECSDFDRARLISEFDAVKKLDPNHPIVVSVSNEFGLPIGQPRGDIVGFSIYHRVYESRFLKSYYEYPIPAWYHGFRAGFIRLLLGRDTMIHELQAEPWGPKPTVELSVDEQNKSMNPSLLAGRVGYAKATGIRSFDLWGLEWWYWRKVHFGDPSLWETARAFWQ